LNIADLFYAVS